MVELKTGFWKEYHTNEYNAIVCTINTVLKSNGELIMGKGIAKQFADRFTFLPQYFGHMTKTNKERDINAHLLIYHYHPSLVGLPTKYDWKEDSNISLIIQGCIQLLTLANCFSWDKILMTRPGCGNGNLNWKIVKKFIKFLDDRFVVINV